MPRGIEVPDTVWNSTTTATVDSDPGGDIWVFVQCWSPDAEGEYVYAAYFPVIDGTAVLGPLDSSIWDDNTPAHGRAQQGRFAAKGFGPWKVIAETTFSVTAA